MKLYMVVASSYLGHYGEEKVCLGVFDTKEKALKMLDCYVDTVKEFGNNYKNRTYTVTFDIAEKFNRTGNYDIDSFWENIDKETLKKYILEIRTDMFTIAELELNMEYPLRISSDEYSLYELEGGIYLGDYIE